MINRDWERFGEDIRRTVQHAVDFQDFGKLNQTITDTVNDAVDTVTRNIRKVRETGKGFKPPVLYRSVTSMQIKGTVTTVLGAVFGGIFLIALLVYLITSWFVGVYGIPEIMVTALFLILGISGFVVCGCGTGIRARIRRFRTYIQVLGKREYCNIQELSKAVKKNILIGYGIVVRMMCLFEGYGCLNGKNQFFKMLLVLRRFIWQVLHLI